MGFDFLHRVRNTSIAAGLVVSLALWAYRGLSPAAAFAAGCVWSLVNLHVIRLLVLVVTGDARSRKLRAAAVLFVKIPVLYGIGYLLLSAARLDAVWLLAGFGWPLLVVVLKAAGRLALGLDAGRTPVSPSGPGASRSTPSSAAPGASRNAAFLAGPGASRNTAFLAGPGASRKGT